jgi:23S rRNA (adenine2503-C2)-methyltransferase
VRDRLLPINRKYPLRDLLAALMGLRGRGKRKVTIEYVLIKNVNDGAEDAKRLARLLKGIPCKVNLIPFNPFPGAQFERPEERSVSAFWRILRDSGLTVLVRHSKGGDVGAACGQLSGRLREPAHAHDETTR